MFGIILIIFLIILFFYVIGTFLLAQPTKPIESIKNVVDHTTKAFKGEK